jgi:WD40 repeat protein
LLTGSHNEVRLWRLPFGEETWQPFGPSLAHEGPVMAAEFSRDGRTLVTGSSYFNGRKGEVRVWDAATGALLSKPQPLSAGVLALAIDPDAKFFITGSRDREAQLWMLDDDRILSRAGPAWLQSGAVTAVAISSDRRFAAAGCDDGVVRFWDIAGGRSVAPPFSRRSRIVALRFHPDGRKLVVGYQDGVIQSWAAPSLLGGSADEVVLWTEEATGAELDNTGVVRALDNAALAKRRQLLEGLWILHR